MLGTAGLPWGSMSFNNTYIGLCGASGLSYDLREFWSLGFSLQDSLHYSSTFKP